MYAPLALSVHNFIDKVGSDAGFASIIGLAILALLLFTQARETSTLRDTAEQAQERIRQLEAQVAHLVRGQPAQSQPAPAQAPQTAVAQPAVAQAAVAQAAATPAPARSAAPAPAAAVATVVPAAAGATALLLPAAPAGTGAPALAAATRLIPVAVPAAAAPPSETGEAGGPSEASEAPASPPPVAPMPAPATAAGSNGAGGAGHAPPPPAPAFTQPPPRVQLRPGGASDTGRRAAPPVRRRPTGGSRVGRGLVLALSAIAIVGIVAVLLIVTSGGNDNQKSHGGTATTNVPNAAHKRNGAAFQPSSVTVTVLNGTATSGAAAKVSGVLGGDGYTEGLTTNADNQLHTTSTVGYLPGHRVAALHVAKALGLTPSTVAAVDPSAQTIACPATSTSCSADVVVTVGADLANK